jgi:hypothetical protein
MKLQPWRATTWNPAEGRKGQPKFEGEKGHEVKGQAKAKHETGLKTRDPLLAIESQESIFQN